jgi:hypothetical protein
MISENMFQGINSITANIGGLGISQWYSAGLRAGWSADRVSVGVRKFSLHHHIQNGSGGHQPPIQWVTGAPFPGSKAAGM